MSNRLFYEVKINDRVVKPAPLDLKLTQRIGDNTLLFARLAYPVPHPSKIQLPVHGSRVEVTWGFKPTELNAWFGYVHHNDVEDEPNPGPDQAIVTVRHCFVGTGWVLGQQRYKEWRRTTDSGIALKIAQDNGLSAVVHRTTKVHDYLLQQGVSDMNWLRERAAEAGRRLHVENGVLYFIDPSSLAMARALRPFPAAMDKAHGQPDRIASFKALDGSLIPKAGQQALRGVHGVDHRTGREIHTKSPASLPGPDLEHRHTMIESMEDLLISARSVAVKNEQWLLAEVDLMGNPALLPGNQLQLSGKAIARRLHGPWLITAAEQHLSMLEHNGLGRKDFSATIEVARNTPAAFAPRDRRMPRVDDRCVGGGNKWRSAAMAQVVL
ncbi:hypothetical protein ACFWYW_24165 [Nonomuraea sp. NPDC059023]|uniref:hypothetical protein n=1 Tax=unclassified Nonomuraea TaxID=2593643 RepID=UPI0036BF1AEA